jgi:hypothetical protein
VLRIEQKPWGVTSVHVPPIEFYDHNDALIATMTKRRFAYGLKLNVHSPTSELLFELQIKRIWGGSRLMIGKMEIARITSVLKGFCLSRSGKFISSLSINDEVPPSQLVRQILIALSFSLNLVLGRL